MNQLPSLLDMKLTLTAGAAVPCDGLLALHLLAFFHQWLCVDVGKARQVEDEAMLATTTIT